MCQFRIVGRTGFISAGGICNYCGCLFTCTVLSSCIGDAGDQPFAVLANEIEQVGPTVVDFAVHEKLKRSPHHGQVVVDSHERIVNAPRFVMFPAFRPDRQTLQRSSEWVCRLASAPWCRQVITVP